LCAAVFAAGVLCAGVATPRMSLVAALAKPPSVLQEKAREVLEKAGWTEPPLDHAQGFAQDSDYLRWKGSEAGQTGLESGRGETGRGSTSEKTGRGAGGRSSERHNGQGQDAHQRPGALFWYRQSPFPLEAQAVNGVVGSTDPAPVTSGMAYVLLDS